MLQLIFYVHQCDINRSFIDLKAHGATFLRTCTTNTLVVYVLVHSIKFQHRKMTSNEIYRVGWSILGSVISKTQVIFKTLNPTNPFQKKKFHINLPLFRQYLFLTLSFIKLAHEIPSFSFHESQTNFLTDQKLKFCSNTIPS